MTLRRPRHALGLSGTMDVRRSFSPDTDDVDVEVSSVTQHFLHDAVRRAPPWARPTRPEDDLGTPLTAGESDERRGGVVVDDLLELAFELLDEFASDGRVGGDVTDLIGLHDVHGEEFGARPRRDPRGAAQEVRVGRGAGDPDDQALAGLPGLSDGVIVEVALQRVLDPVGQPQQRQLAKRAEVAHAKVVRQ